MGSGPWASWSSPSTRSSPSRAQFSAPPCADSPIAGADPPARPTRAELLAAAGRTVPDLVAPGLRVLFCGINPGLYSGATGHHFARPGNRFWPALQAAGFSDQLLAAREEHRLLERGYGITNLVARATAGADELTRDELVAGRRRLERLVRRTAPRWVAVLGLGAYRAAFARPLAAAGPQAEPLAGARVWVLPNPSGLNAHYQLPDLAREFAALHAAVHRFDRHPSVPPRPTGEPR